MKPYPHARIAALFALVAAPLALPIAAFAQSTTSQSTTSQSAAPQSTASQSTTSQTATPHDTMPMKHSGTVVGAVLKNRTKNVEAHITLLHQELQITPAEETQWGAFAQVMRNNAAQMDAAFSQRGQAIETMTAVQDMQSYAQIAQVQSDNMQKLSAAFQTLYASFPAPQQKIADSVFRPKEMKH